MRRMNGLDIRLQNTRRSLTGSRKNLTKRGYENEYD